jgi:hypothetical protein
MFGCDVVLSSFAGNDRGLSPMCDGDKLVIENKASPV